VVDVTPMEVVVAEASMDVATTFVMSLSSNSVETWSAALLHAHNSSKTQPNRVPKCFIR